MAPAPGVGAKPLLFHQITIDGDRAVPVGWWGPAEGHGALCPGLYLRGLRGVQGRLPRGWVEHSPTMSLTGSSLPKPWVQGQAPSWGRAFTVCTVHGPRGLLGQGMLQAHNPWPQPCGHFSGCSGKSALALGTHSPGPPQAVQGVWGQTPSVYPGLGPGSDQSRVQGPF